MGFLQLLLKAISPELRNLIVDFILGLPKAVKKSDNPLDSIFVDLLISEFAVRYDKEVKE